MAPLLWFNSACNCWTVSCISLQSAGSLLLCQEHRRTARKCQRYSRKRLCTLLMIWQIIIDFLKLLFDFDKQQQQQQNIKCFTLLFLTAYHYSLSAFFPSHMYQSRCHGRLANLNVPYFEWHWMSSLDINVSLKPEAIKIPKLSFGGCSTWISTRSCGMKKQSVQYTSHFSIHSMQAMVICSGNGSSCLNCGISRVLESWPFL